MKKAIVYIGILSGLLLLSGACKDSESIDDEVGDGEGVGYDWSQHAPFKTSYSTFNMPYTSSFDQFPEEKGRVGLEEASGIAYSQQNPGMVWVHNDGGNTAVLYLVDVSTGVIVARYGVQGMTNTDWEDIEISTGPKEGVPYLYVSDTGDNDAKRVSSVVYRFEEPVLEDAHRNAGVVSLSRESVALERIIFRYPGGSQDVESLFVDPSTKDIFLVSKRSAVSTLFVLPYPQTIDQSYEGFKAGEFSFREASAATASHDGSRIMIKNRQDIFYWERQSGESTVDMLARTPVRAPYIGELQGEAICFDRDMNYYTISEQANSNQFPILYKYTKK